jgi:predicted O-methyltransferase YrrM
MFCTLRPPFVAAGRAKFIRVAAKNNYLASDAICEYVRAVGVNEPGVLRRLREETAGYPNAQMQISPEQGQFFRLLLAAIQARKTLEIGVFTGYSSIAAALALPPEGRVVACDSSDEYTRVARRYWKEAGVEEKIELRLGPAAETLRALHKERAAESFDFVFIDADKTSYDLYYELSLPLVRRGGLIALDNTLRRGDVVNREIADPDVLAIRALNEKLHNDTRVFSVLLPVADGLTVAVKL